MIEHLHIKRLTPDSEDLVRKGLIYFYQEEINSKDKLNDFNMYMKELERCEFMDK